MKQKILFILQFNDDNKHADLILFDIPEKNYIQAYMHMHKSNVAYEHLKYKRYHDYDVDVAVFGIPYGINYVFMIITLPIYNGHSYESFCKSINVQNLAYNMLWDVEEVWRKE